ncbi:MAG: sigma-70 family RNA polymerase sigma factor [Oscillospiraceae bacterium]|nr:sigma-70 family RNA polymerase sigma factor [Oscillospiraceae bacterium]
MIDDYSVYSDEELLRLSAGGDGSAGSELAHRYRPLIRRCTRPYYLLGGDNEDLIQEGMIGLVHSMHSFDEKGGAAFRSYAELCIKRRILDAIKAAGRLKHMPLNTGLSLDELGEQDNADKSALAELSYSPSPEELLIRQEERKDVYQMARSILSPLERRVMDCYLEGLSYDEIAQRCGKNVKSVDAALQRIRKKLSAAFDE